MQDTSFFVLEITGDSPEVYQARYKRVTCGQCGLRPVARVGKTGVKFTKKAEMTDFAYTDAGLIARGSVFDTFAEHQLSGWRQGLLDIQIKSHLKSINSDYYELIVIGSTQGYAEAVGLKVRDECEECGRKRYWRPLHGLTMPSTCWDKRSDIFVIPELPALYIVTEQMCNLIQEAQFSGVECTRLVDWHAPYGTQREAEREGAIQEFDPDSHEEMAAKIWPPLKPSP